MGVAFVTAQVPCAMSMVHAHTLKQRSGQQTDAGLCKGMAHRMIGNFHPFRHCLAYSVLAAGG